jgi:hypothetical protein
MARLYAQGWLTPDRKVGGKTMAATTVTMTPMITMMLMITLQHLHPTP